jgi:hypothetical protein
MEMAIPNRDPVPFNGNLVAMFAGVVAAMSTDEEADKAFKAVKTWFDTRVAAFAEEEEQKAEEKAVAGAKPAKRIDTAEVKPPENGGAPADDVAPNEVPPADPPTGPTKRLDLKGE